MIEKKVIVNLQSGLHARPAALMVQKANAFHSEVFIQKNGREVSAKSIMGLMSLALTKGMEVSVIAKGEDEEEAVNALVDFLSQGEASI